LFDVLTHLLDQRFHRVEATISPTGTGSSGRHLALSTNSTERRAMTGPEFPSPRMSWRRSPARTTPCSMNSTTAVPRPVIVKTSSILKRNRPADSRRPEA
jgi:hypothetical protein